MTVGAMLFLGAVVAFALAMGQAVRRWPGLFWWAVGGSAILGLGLLVLGVLALTDPEGRGVAVADWLLFPGVTLAMWAMVAALKRGVGAAWRRWGP